MSFKRKFVHFNATNLTLDFYFVEFFLVGINISAIKAADIAGA
jgi:hypothetical protein